MSPHSFVTTSRGLDRSSPPMRLFEKAKRLGAWNPSEIPLEQDRQDWQGLQADEQDLLLRLTALFQAGEEAVTRELLPLIGVIAGEGRLEEEMFLTSFLFEEAKHTDFFQRFLTEVAKSGFDLSHYHTPSYWSIFYEALPTALGRLRHDPSPAAQVEAAVTYNMIVESVLAETGYHAYFQVLAQNGILSGTQQAITLLKQDESRHIAYGIYLISRLVAAESALWEVAEATMNRLLPDALGVIADAFASYDPVPFGLEESLFADYATSQFQKRLARIEQARNLSQTGVLKVTQAIIEAEDG